MVFGSNSIEQALAQLPPFATFRIANQARTPDRYLFSQYLPERNEPNYEAASGTMTLRPIMAGLSGMDSPYPPGGVIEQTAFNENVAKIANRVRMSEKDLRKLQALIQSLQIRQVAPVPYVLNEVLNFFDKMVLQAHLDTMEYLRGRALVNGAINWTNNGITLAVDYGIPSANILPNRTGNDAWGGSASKFWTDIALLQAALKYNVRAYVVHPTTWTAILGNDVNKIEVIGGDGQSTFQIRKLVGTTDRPSTDVRNVITLQVYGLEASKISDSDPTATTDIPFMPQGKILAIANNTGTVYQVGAGSTEVLDIAIGYTHIAPTVEGDGIPGRWGRLYKPEQEQWAVVAEGVTNGLPVIEEPKKIAVASSD